MKIPKKFAVVLLLAMILFSSCILNWDKMFGFSYPVSERSTHIRDILLSDPYFPTKAVKKYSILVLTDVHFGTSPSSAEIPFFAWLDAYLAVPENPQLAFCAILGDITNSGTREECAAFNTFADKLRKIPAEGGRDIPVFPVLGNHDVYPEGDYGKIPLSDIYPYTSAYRIRTEKTSFYFLDTADGTLGAPQLNDLLIKLRNDLNKKITFTHYPLYDDSTIYYRMLNVAERMKLIGSYAESNVAFAFCGHVHISKDVDFGAFTECIVSGFEEKKAFVLLTIDENSETFSYRHIYF